MNAPHLPDQLRATLPAIEAALLLPRGALTKAAEAGRLPPPAEGPGGLLLWHCSDLRADVDCLKENA